MARTVGKPAASTPVTATRHAKDQRVNIPTAELEAFAEDEEKRPATLRYPRDTDKDPQLVWKGKDEQDRHDLAVPAVPIYIQEQIEPRAIIEDLRAQTAAGRDAQLDLFADFDGIPFEERVEFYRHPMHWTNRLILGDSLQVMASLADKEGLNGQVQCIYLDPPYGIRFGSNWQVSTRSKQVTDGKAEDATRQPEQVRAFRDTWKNGINSYLSYLRDRMTAARELLTETGSIFVQIGDENVHLVRSLLDEIFGGDNFVAMIQFVTTGGQTTLGPAPVTDHLLWYARTKGSAKYRQLMLEQERASLAPTISWYFELPDGELRPLSRAETANPASLPKGGRLLWLSDLLSRSGGPSTQFEVTYDGSSFRPTRGGWRTNATGMQRLLWARRLARKGRTLLFRRYLEDYPFTDLSTLWLDTQLGGFAAKPGSTDRRGVTGC